MNDTTEMAFEACRPHFTEEDEEDEDYVLAQLADWVINGNRAGQPTTLRLRLDAAAAYQAQVQLGPPIICTPFPPVRGSGASALGQCHRASLVAASLWSVAPDASATTKS